MDFFAIAYGLYDIANTSSTLEKKRLLKQYAEIPGFLEVIKYIYDPYFTTGIGKRNLELVSALDYEYHPQRVMDYLKEHSTGMADDIELALTFICQSNDEIWQWAATGLVTKDLQIGVSVTTLNNVFGISFIPKTGIMRGMQCPSDVSGIYIATEKIDGNRRLIMTKEDKIEIYTRSGKRDYGLVELEEQAWQLPAGYVYDTECVAVGDFADSIELRQASASILNAAGTRRGVKALCFDAFPIEEYLAGQSKHAAYARKAFLAGIFGDESVLTIMRTWFDAHKMSRVSKAIDMMYMMTSERSLPNITSLPILGIIENYTQALEVAKPIWDAGGEGIMLVEWLSPYEVNPNPRKTLLKVKATKEYQLKCVDVVEGENKYEGMLGAIVVEYQRPGDSNTYLVKVGSGFPDYLRAEYWDEPDKIVGKIVEIESFGESKNQQGSYSLNCPIFKRIKNIVD